MDIESTPTIFDAIRSLPPALAAALVAAQGMVRRVAKDATNNYAKYDYASAEDMIDEARGCLNDNGLALMSSWELVATGGGRERKTDDGRTLTVGTIGRVVVHYTLMHVSGVAVAFDTSLPVIPEKGRPEDKAELSALTADLAYTLRGLLLIPRGDAPGESVDSRDDTGYDRATFRGMPLPAVPVDTGRRPPPSSGRAQGSTDIPFANPGDPGEGSPPVADPFVEMMKDGCAAILAAPAVADVLATLDACTKLKGFPAQYVNALQKAAVRRIIAIATSRSDLATASNISKATTAEDEWFEETTTLYKARRAEIEVAAKDQGRA